MTDATSSNWRFDLQTLILIGGIGATLVAWGYTLSQLQSDTDRNSKAVSDLSVRIEKNDYKTDLSEARIASLEKVASEALSLRRELDGTVSEFKSDLAVIKEILERQEKKNP